MSEKIRVLLADDHTIFRSGIKAELSAHPDFEVVGEANDGLDAVVMALETKPDVILLDMSMPRSNGIEALTTIKDEMPDIQVIMLTVHTDDKHLFEAIKRGANGYLTKNLKPADLLDMLRKAKRREAAINGMLAARILNEFRNPAKSDVTLRNNEDALTEREMDVLELVVQGKTNAEIAEVLVVSEHTVKMHLANILSKLHLQNRVQVAVHAVRKGLVDNIQ